MQCVHSLLLLFLTCFSFMVGLYLPVSTQCVQSQKDEKKIPVYIGLYGLDDDFKVAR